MRLGPCHAVLALVATCFVSGHISAASSQSAEILHRARAAVLDPLAAGKAVRGKVYFEISLGSKVPQRYWGHLTQIGDETDVVLTPSFDPHGPGGAAIPGTEIRIAIRAHQVLWTVRSATPSSSGSDPLEFPLPAAQGERFCLLVPPSEWMGLEFQVRTSGVDPHALMPSPFTELRSRPEDAHAYWVLTSARQSPAARGYVGQIQLWLQRSTGLLEQLVITLQQRERGRKEEVIRASISFEDVRME